MAEVENLTLPSMYSGLWLFSSGHSPWDPASNLLASPVGFVFKALLEPTAPSSHLAQARGSPPSTPALQVCTSPSRFLTQNCLGVPLREGASAWRGPPCRPPTAVCPVTQRRQQQGEGLQGRCQPGGPGGTGASQSSAGTEWCLSTWGERCGCQVPV